VSEPEKDEREDPGQITGYAVALPGRSDAVPAIWFGGGKLAAALTLPQLHRRWSSHEQQLTQPALTPEGLARVPRTLEEGDGHRRTGSG
jgi:hypothetical protein